MAVVAISQIEIITCAGFIEIFRRSSHCSTFPGMPQGKVLSQDTAPDSAIFAKSGEIA
jgi:hypothetical protein